MLTTTGWPSHIFGSCPTEMVTIIKKPCCCRSGCKCCLFLPEWDLVSVLERKSTGLKSIHALYHQALSVRYNHECALCAVDDAAQPDVCD